MALPAPVISDLWQHGGPSEFVFVFATNSLSVSNTVVITALQRIGLPCTGPKRAARESITHLTAFPNESCTSSPSSSSSSGGSSSGKIKGQTRKKWVAVGAQSRDQGMVQGVGMKAAPGCLS